MPDESSSRQTPTRHARFDLSAASTFNYETIDLVQRGEPMLAALNVAATLIVCLLAGVLGLGLARAIIG